MKNISNEACKELLESASPFEWMCFLFDLQNTLIGYGFMEGLTKEGVDNLTNKFISLKFFFEKLENSSKS
jgi:hypothetical protein